MGGGCVLNIIATVSGKPLPIVGQAIFHTPLWSRYLMVSRLRLINTVVMISRTVLPPLHQRASLFDSLHMRVKICFLAVYTCLTKSIERLVRDYQPNCQAANRSADWSSKRLPGRHTASSVVNSVVLACFLNARSIRI